MTITKNKALDRIVLPQAPEPLGQYSAVSEANGLIFLSGMLPIRDGEMAFSGHLDKTKAREAAYLAALNALSVLKKHYGLDQIKGVVQAAVYISSEPGFEDHAFVADGCSELLNRIFPEKHSRLVFGVSSLPRDASVELALIFELNRK